MRPRYASEFRIQALTEAELRNFTSDGRQIAGADWARNIGPHQDRAIPEALTEAEVRNFTSDGRQTAGANWARNIGPHQDRTIPGASSPPKAAGSLDSRVSYNYQNRTY
jgi:hypothetical protein